jgi:ATP phosphoribosyltransferase
LARFQGQSLTSIPAAKQYVLCQYNVERKNLEAVTKVTPGRRAATINALEEEGWVAVSSMVEKKRIATVMDELSSLGAEDILVMGILNTRT